LKEEIRIRKIRHQSNPKINITSSFTKCHECGELVSKSEIFDSKYCKNCYKTIELARKKSLNRCGNCHEYFNPSLSTDPHHCPECVKKMRRCRNCHKEFIPQGIILLCPLCYSEKVRICEVCKKDFIPKTRSRRVCPKCQERVDHQTLNQISKKQENSNEIKKSKKDIRSSKTIEVTDKTCELLIKALNDKNKDNREFARDALIKMGTNSVELIIQSLNSSSKKRKVLVDILVEIGEDSIDCLIKSLEDSDYLIKKNCAIVLGLIGDNRAVEPLIKSLNDYDSSVRRSAANSLEIIGDNRAVEPLINALRSEKNIRTKREIVASLGKFEDQKAIEPLIETLEVENPKLTIASLISLVEIDCDVGLEFLKKNLNNPDEGVVDYSKKTIISIKDEKYLDNLLKSITPNDHKIPKTELVELEEDLFNTDPEIRKVAARKLGKSGHPSASNYLIDALEDSDEEVRLESIKALGKLRNLDSLPILIITLLNDDFWMTSAAQEAIADFGPSAIPSISKSIVSENDTLRYYLVELLGEIKDENSESLLINALNDPDTAVKEKAIESLANVGTDNAFNPLITTLNNETDRKIKKKTAKTIGKICQKKDLKIFIDTLKKNFPNDYYNKKLIKKTKNRIKRHEMQELSLSQSEDTDQTSPKVNEEDESVNDNKIIENTEKRQNEIMQ